MSVYFGLIGLNVEESCLVFMAKPGRISVHDGRSIANAATQRDVTQQYMCTILKLAFDNRLHDNYSYATFCRNISKMSF